MLAPLDYPDGAWSNSGREGHGPTRTCGSNGQTERDIGLEGSGECWAERVVRGGSWNNNARNVRSAYRNNDDPGNANHNQGFRLARARSRIGGSTLTQPLSCPGPRGRGQKAQGPGGASSGPEASSERSTCAPPFMLGVP